MNFKGHTVVITGAGGGLGKSYSLLFASRGANVVVNDFNKEAAQKVVDEITQAGGKAVVNTSSATDGVAVIQSATDAFGTVTILINNAGILRDKGFKKMTDKEFDAVIEVHLKGAFACTKAAWPHFRKQKFGRVVNTASAAGLYGNFGQANYSAAKMGLIGFTKTLAIEGVKYGIKAIALAPIAASPMTETIMPPEMLANLQPTLVAPFVLAVCHPDGPDASGKVFEVGAGFVAEIRWERSTGTVFKTDSSFTPSAVKAKFADITDFSKPYYPKSYTDVDAKGDSKGFLAQAAKASSNKQASPPVQFAGKTVIITGAGAGLGRTYALMYAKLGANVVVNDVSDKAANAVANEITSAGGKAIAVICSAEDGDAIVKAALDKFGEKEWDDVIQVHLRGTYKCAKAVWPIFQEQKYGRIITTASQVGIYGNFGQANVSYCPSRPQTRRLISHSTRTAKAALIGLTRTLGFEGKKYNILANVIRPLCRNSDDPNDMPDYMRTLCWLLEAAKVHNTETTSSLFEVLGGWAAQTRWQRSGGYSFPTKVPFKPEDVKAKWAQITAFGALSTRALGL
ncbi:peroxisomal hydratase-dehydrogenase-epimerase [Mycena amicta]|nr:peroxisomal hydratase-dehydrogenase-epimerase [Mycena amicta]